MIFALYWGSTMRSCLTSTMSDSALIFAACISAECMNPSFPDHGSFPRQSIPSPISRLMNCGDYEEERYEERYEEKWGERDILSHNVSQIRFVLEENSDFNFPLCSFIFWCEWMDAEEEFGRMGLEVLVNSLVVWVVKKIQSFLAIFWCYVLDWLLDLLSSSMKPN